MKKEKIKLKLLNRSNLLKEKSFTSYIPTRTSVNNLT